MRKINILIFILIIINNNFAQDCNLEPIKKGNKYGYRDNSGKLKIEAKFTNAYNFSRGLAAVSEKIKGEERYGYIDCEGKYIINPLYTNASAFDENDCAVVGGFKNSTDINGKPCISHADGLINRKGDTIIPINYLSIIRAFNVYEARHGAFRENATLFDKHGKNLGEYDDIIRFMDSSMVVVQNGKYGILDGNGNFILPLIADKIGMTYKPGNEYMSSNFDLFSSKSEAVFYVNGKQGIVARNGKILLDPFSNDAFEFVNQISYKGTKRVKKNGKWGFMDTTLTKVIIPIIYEYADNFYESYAAVKLNGKCGFIDIHHNIIIPFQYDEASSFVNGRANVVLNGIKMKIDENGNWIDKPQPTPKQPKCLQSCPDCGGTGTRMKSTANKCGYCDGTGKYGYNYFTIGGQTRMEPKACPHCDGSGRSFGSTTTFEYCKTCNQTGCIKFE